MTKVNKRARFALTTLLGLCAGIASIEAAESAPCGQLPVEYIQAKDGKGKAAVKHPRGRKNPSAGVLKARHQAAFLRNDHLTARLQIRGTPVPATYMCPIYLISEDQAQCGSCWDFSGCEVCTNAIIIASNGALKPDGSFFLSPQYILDCTQNGGCDGDDNVTVLGYAMNQGIPATSAYGPYQAQTGRCQFQTGTTLYKITNWGYCTPAQSQGVAATVDIKNYMMTYGPIGTGVAAGDDWDSYQAGTILYGRGGEVNHDVEIVGWDDAKVASDGTQGVWYVMNSWGPSWGNNGVCMMAYGAESIGTEAVWAVAGIQPVPTPPVPTPPGPTPPPPPTPSPCVPYFHLFGTPHFRCDGQATNRQIRRSMRSAYESYAPAQYGTFTFTNTVTVDSTRGLFRR